MITQPLYHSHAKAPLGRFSRSALAAMAVLVTASVAGPAAAVPKAVSDARSSRPVGETADQRLARDLAAAIVAHLPPAPLAGAKCDSDARAVIKASVEAVIAKSNAAPAIAVNAIELARAQPQRLDPCRDGALADSATESAGNGEVVDEADAVRGFTLYTGPWPPPPPAPQAVVQAEPTPPIATAPMAGTREVRAHRRHHQRHRGPVKSILAEARP